MLVSVQGCGFLALIYPIISVSEVVVTGSSAKTPWDPTLPCPRGLTPMKRVGQELPNQNCPLTQTSNGLFSPFCTRGNCTMQRGRIWPNLRIFMDNAESGKQGFQGTGEGISGNSKPGSVCVQGGFPENCHRESRLM
ncbi:hypothetical protein KIL84_016963 [Mauremys mutica]|uniref:Secreted protein n=1 Tax=Mauremys mutica TaxID=74926 RepID=A0A9D3X045_9SAUR|nr:hypothetical protein KIL84_016963 [Mauremys mutica]